tara:strand:- start:305 stop:1129 length:825 start_codon:yes stop_codon:yes gene_type:complete
MHYKPNILIINNIEFDHADIFEDINSIIKSFHHLVRLVPKTGHIIYDCNDRNIKKLFKLGNWSYSTPLSLKSNNNIKWNLTYKKNKYFLNKKELTTELIGIHNFKNAALAIITASILKIPLTQSFNAMKEFSGVRRRMEKIHEIKKNDKIKSNNIKIYDDFAHHPTEISYSISSIKRKFKGKKVLSICEIRSNSMLQGVHRNDLFNALKISDLSLVVSNKKLDWKFSNEKNKKITMLNSYQKINKYVKENINNIDLILIMTNADSKNILKYIKK